MAGKMYYSEQEVAQKLGISAEEIANYVRDDKLRVFQDGGRKMYKASEVDALAAAQGSGEIDLTPAEPSTADVVTLGDIGEPIASGAEDTVITAEGISIFDEEDLEIEAADPMAKTQIAPSLEDQIAIEGVGSGSGLLDLTRESDDTSLGAEVLDHIDMEGAVGSGIAPETAAIQVPAVDATLLEPPTFVEVLDAASGAFNGILISCAAVMVMLGAVMLASYVGLLPEYLVVFKENIVPVLAGAVVAVIIGIVAGYLTGKSAAARQEMMRQA